MRVVQELEGWMAQQKGQQQCRALEQYSVVRKLQLASWGGLMGGQRDESRKTLGQDHKGLNVT